MLFVFMYISPCRVSMNFSPTVYPRFFFFLNWITKTDMSVGITCITFYPWKEDGRKKGNEAFWREIIGWYKYSRLQKGLACTLSSAVLNTEPERHSAGPWPRWEQHWAWFLPHEEHHWISSQCTLCECTKLGEKHSVYLLFPVPAKLL